MKRNAGLSIYSRLAVVSLRSVCLLLITAWLFLAPTVVGAEQGTVSDAAAIAWSQPVNVSQSLPTSMQPAIIADHEGLVHLFWSEDVGGVYSGGDEGIRRGNSIAYSQWDGYRWTPAVDILSVPGQSIAGFPSVALDAENRLHLVWAGHNTIYYSSAMADAAGSTHAWSSPTVVIEAALPTGWPMAITVDSAFNLHVVLADNRYGGAVGATRSFDGGATWEPMLEISVPPDPLEMSASHVRLVVDPMDRLHATWQTNQIEGYGQAVYYARSLDGGSAWEPPIRFGYRRPGGTFTEHLNLGIRGEREIHAFYVDGWHAGRWHRVSYDAGETWSDAELMITDLEGINGFMAPVTDDAGRLQLIINMRTREDQVIGIYHASWLENNWSGVRPVDVTSPASFSAHAAAATLRLGNEIHVAYVDLRRAEVWHVYGIISDIAPRPIEPSSAAMVGPLPTVVLQPTPLPTAVPSAPVGFSAVVEEHGVPAEWGLMAGALGVVALFAAVALHMASSRGHGV